PRADLADLDFETICGDATAGDGEKRVAVLIDYGLDADATNGDDVPAPTADCAVVPEKATGLQVLDSVGETRLGDKNSLCAINGYPGTGCFEPAKQESAKDGDPVEFTVAGAGDDSSSDEADEDSNNGILIGGAVVVIVALGVGGVLLNRRRSA
ncbi:MAG: hypothetical protein L0H93_04695, partial [Nocardioides sp.]|nr:hypothetical protein [Nocardioides sp.]